MAKGITETDVWQAADALLLEGGRPTIERVRQKIGRGSPNTVTPYLETWFKHLGGRIKDPGAFSAPAALPDPILQAAQHFWEVALAEARKETEDKLVAGMDAAELLVAQAAQRVDLAESDSARLRFELERVTSDLVDAKDVINNEAMAHASTRAQLETARDQKSDLGGQLRILEVQLKAAREDAQSQLAAAEARATNAEKRAALDMDRERVARATAEKRLTNIETKFEKALAEHSRERVELATQQARLKSELEQQTLQCTQLRNAIGEAEAKAQALLRKCAAAEAQAVGADRILSHRADSNLSQG